MLKKYSLFLFLETFTWLVCVRASVCVFEVLGWGGGGDENLELCCHRPVCINGVGGWVVGILTYSRTFRTCIFSGVLKVIIFL